MATTRIIPMHRNKGKTVAQCLRDRTEYAKNPAKTEGGELISAYECTAENVDIEFALARKEYLRLTGRERSDEVIAYQLRQSFKPGEITPEEANHVGYETAMRFLKGNHAFIVATHTDRKHIHNHIIFNSVALDCLRKFKNFHLSGLAFGRLSNQICLEHKLSIIGEPKENKGPRIRYNKWLGENAKPSGRELLRYAIDDALAKNPDGFDTLMRWLEETGWEIKQRGKQWSFRAPDAKRFIRMDTLGDEYSEAALKSIIKGERIHHPRKRNILSPKKVSLLIDIQKKMQSGKGRGYENWAKVFNVKHMSKAMAYLSENNIEYYEDLEIKVTQVTSQYDELGNRIKASEARMKEIADLKKQIITYMRTKDIYAQWKKSGWSKGFEEQHREEILLHKAAKQAFDAAGLQKLPSIKTLSAEYDSLAKQKQQDYSEYRKIRDEMRELAIVKANVDRLTERDEEKSHTVETRKGSQNRG